MLGSNAEYLLGRVIPRAFGGVLDSSPQAGTLEECVLALRRQSVSVKCIFIELYAHRELSGVEIELVLGRDRCSRNKDHSSDKHNGEGGEESHSVRSRLIQSW